MEVMKATDLKPTVRLVLVIAGIEKQKININIRKNMKKKKK